MCQVESVIGLQAIDEIAQVEGVSAIFLGPSDLGADMGFLGQTQHPEVVAAVSEAITRVRSAGLAAGVLAPNSEIARDYKNAGANFVGVGVDALVLARSLRDLAAESRS